MIEAVAALTIIALIWWLVVRSHRADQQLSLKVRADLDRVLLEERDAMLSKWPAPQFELPDDPEYAPIYRDFIAKMVLPWSKYFDESVISEKEMLMNYRAAGEVLTPELREHICYDARCRKYLNDIDVAKEAAFRKIGEDAWQREKAEYERADALRNIENFRKRKVPL